MISGWSQHQVLNRAKIENIEIGTDIEEVKKKLVHKLAFAELERIKKQRENNAKDLHSSSPVEVNPENYLNKSTTKIFN
jgi:flagellar biosynthesis/type III secretory pathway chaperone